MACQIYAYDYEGFLPFDVIKGICPINRTYAFFIGMCCFSMQLHKINMSSIKGSFGFYSFWLSVRHHGKPLVCWMAVSGNLEVLSNSAELDEVV